MIFDDNIYINCLIRRTALNFNLIIQNNTIKNIKRANDLHSGVVEICRNISVYLKSVTVSQTFFIMKHNSHFCILSHSYENATHLIRIIDNKDTVLIYIFDSVNKKNQVLFLEYFSDDYRDQQLNDFHDNISALN